MKGGRGKETHFSNVLVPFLHADPHFHSLFHEARRDDNCVRLPRHRSSKFLDRHLDQMPI
jgi:hypothetical protein